MDKRQITRLALRLFGLYSAISALSVLEPALRELSRLSEPNNQSAEAFYGTSALVVWGLAAIVLLGFGGSIAERWCVGEPATAADATATLRARDFELVGYRLLGVLAIVSNLSACIEVLVSLARWGGDGGWPEIAWYGLGSIATLALGVGLLLGARGLANLLDRLRGAGLQPTEQAWKTPRA
jgi:hypothetical protein